MLHKTLPEEIKAELLILQENQIQEEVQLPIQVIVKHPLETVFQQNRIQLIQMF